MLVAGGVLLLAFLAIAAYVHIKLEMSEATLSVVPLLILPAGFALGAKAARSKRIRREREVAAYEEALARASDWG